MQARSEIAQLLRDVLALHARGAFDEAAQLCVRALRGAPRHVDALYLLGVSEYSRGRINEALDQFNRALAIAPGHARSHAAKGTLLLALRRPADAVRPLRRAIQLAPGDAEAHMHLALALDGSGGDLAATRAAFDQALRLAPDNADAHYNLATVLRRHGQLAEAVGPLRRAVELNPSLPDAWNNLGLTLRDLGDRDGAIAAWRQGVARARPGDAAAAPLWSNLGNLLDRPEESAARREAHRHAVELAPNDARCHLNYAIALQDAGSEGLAWIHLGRAYDLDPEATGRQQPEIGYYRARDEVDLLALRRAEGEKLIAATAAERAPHANPRDPEKRLRIGYVSPDLRASSVAFFIEPVLAAHDTAALEIFCYANVHAPDGVTARLQTLGHAWRDVAAIDDAALGAQVRADGIDILVDLAGQTKFHRLGAFACKPAPVQVTWIGSPSSTGLAAIDWRIVDGLTDPPGLTEAHNSERLLRLPGGFLCYGPPEQAPAVAAPPSAARGHVTFGSFNHIAKVGDAVIRLWSDVLKRVPASRLLLKHAGLGDEPARRLVLQQFAANGIGAERLDLRARTPNFAAHLADYGDMDIALDPFPYNGTTTTCEALWMGVPVVTLAGQRHMGRVGVSLLTRSRLGDLIAETPKAYLDVAAGLASDPARLAALRDGMRARLAASPLTDAVSLTRELEAAYRTLWREWCER